MKLRFTRKVENSFNSTTAPVGPQITFVRAAAQTWQRAKPRLLGSLDLFKYSQKSLQHLNEGANPFVYRPNTPPGHIYPHYDPRHQAFVKSPELGNWYVINHRPSLNSPRSNHESRGPHHE